MRKKWIMAGALGMALTHAASAAYTNALINPATHNGSFEGPIVQHPTDATTDRGIAVDGWNLSWTGYWARFTQASYVSDSATEGFVGVTFNGGVTVNVVSEPIYQALNSNDVLTLTFDMVDRSPGTSENTTYEAVITLNGNNAMSFGVIPITDGQYSGQVVVPADTLFYTVKIIGGVGGSDGQNCFDNVVLTRFSDYPLEPEAEFLTFMGDGVCNGDLQTNEVAHLWTNAARTNELTLIRNSSGRIMWSGTSNNYYLDFNGWSAHRTYYKGGNDAWGIDGSAKGDLAGYPNTYCFINSGDFTLTSSNCPVSLFSGDRVMVQIDMMSGSVPFSTNSPSDHVFANCGGMITFNDGAFTNSWAPEETYVTNALQVTTFTTTFDLPADVTNMQVVVDVSSGRGYDNRFRDGSNNQVQVDNIHVFGVRGAGIPIEIMGFEQVATDIYSLEVAVSGVDRPNSYPVAKNSLTEPTWSQIPHSDDGVNPYVVSNFLYSTESGSNRVIYVQSSDVNKFLKVEKN